MFQSVSFGTFELSCGAKLMFVTVEDHVGIPWERKKKKKRVNEDESNKEEDDEHSSDGHDDSEVGEDSKSLGSDKSSSDHEEELNIGDSPGEPSEPIVTDHGFNIDEVLRTEADGLETNLNILADYHKVKNGNSEESSVPLLFDYLPNIKTLYLVQPEDCGINNQKVQEAAILQKLETVHLCSSLRKSKFCGSLHDKFLLTALRYRYQRASGISDGATRNPSVPCYPKHTLTEHSYNLHLRFQFQFQ